MNIQRQYGLVGKTLKHSFSERYFKKKFLNENIENAIYRNYEMDDLSEIFVLAEDGIGGLNVTIPYKEKVIPLLDDLRGDARLIQAVNTIKVEKGKLIGYNSDTYGFRESIRPLIPSNIKAKALILGTGGASKAVEFVLQEFGYSVQFASRSAGDIRYNELSKDYIAGCPVIVNTTPLGMYPNNHQKPDIPYDGIGQDHLLVDLVYNPEKTLFLEQGESRGATILNGYRMLELQAEHSWEIWNT
jgi:shikimate dehydrogenase